MEHPTPHRPTDAIDLSHHLENASLGVIHWDEDVNITYCSKAAANIFAAVPEDFMQQSTSLLPLISSDDTDDPRATLRELLSGELKHREHLSRHLTKDNKQIYCRWHHSVIKDDLGNTTSILSIVKDVTKDLESKLTLEKSQRQLSLAFNSAIDPMWLIRCEGNNRFRFETINHAFTKVTGWTAEQVEGQPIENVMPAASHELVRGKYNEAIASGKIIDYIEEALHPSGIKYGEIRVIPITGMNGEPERILGIANDITERVSLQKKLDAERETRSRQVTTAAIRGQESGRAKVSRELHDNLNQILTTVKLYVELCRDQKIESTETLAKCAVLLGDTITEIRVLSKQLSAPSLGNINFRESLGDLVDSLRPAAQLEVTVDFDHISFNEMDSELHLTVYRLAQEQLTNIIKYAKASAVRMSLQEENSFLHLTIEDNGMGFDPAQKSNGIGITNMQSRVEILNGRFQLISRFGEGTKLDVDIPVIVEENVCYAEQSVLHHL